MVETVVYSVLAGMDERITIRTRIPRLNRLVPSMPLTVRYCIVLSLGALISTSCARSETSVAGAWVLSNESNAKYRQSYGSDFAEANRSFALNKDGTCTFVPSGVLTQCNWQEVGNRILIRTDYAKFYKDFGFEVDQEGRVILHSNSSRSQITMVLGGGKLSMNYVREGVEKPLQAKPVGNLPKESYALSAADIKHGETELKRLISDRPAMKLKGIVGSPVWKWAVRQFAGASLGRHMNWSNHPVPVPGYNAAHVIAGPKSEPYIAIAKTGQTPDSKGRSLGAEELWSLLSFEICNATHLAKRVTLDALAQSGKIKRDDFVQECAKTEYYALLELTAVYYELWGPWAEREGHPASGGFTWGEGTGSFSEWIGHYTDKSSYPYDVFGPRFDDLASKGK